MIAILLIAIIASAAGTAYATKRLDQTRTESRVHLRPAQLDVAALSAAYFAEQSGLEAFMLAGDRRALEPFVSGAASAKQLEPELAKLIADDTTARKALARVTTEATRWRNEVALPQLAARDLGTIPSDQLVSMSLQGIPYVVELRTCLQMLSDRIAALALSGQQRYDDAQRTANLTTGVAFGLALIAVLLTLVVLLRAITRPLRHLRKQIKEVADGSHDQVIIAGGAREIVQIGDSVEYMRRNLLANSAALVAAHKQMVLRDERDRIAADLHDMTIQRVFGIGLMVRALGQRHPEILDDVETLVEASDETIRELRNLIFGFREELLSGALSELVQELVVESNRALGFMPTLEIDPLVDQLADEEIAIELLAALREVLSNIARHAHASAATVVLAVVDGHIQLRVTDNGIGVAESGPQGNGHANLLARAVRLGGSVTVGRAETRGTEVNWRVPAQ